jgi:monoterpene epsilon-lactone hydrolase
LSVAARLVNWLLPLRGSRHTMRTEGRMAARYSRHRQRHAEPPGALVRRFAIQRYTLDGMAYYHLTPHHQRPSHRLLYIHGGAYVNELIRPHWRIIGAIASRIGAAVYVPIYPLAPRHCWQDAYPPLKALAQRVLHARGDSAVTFIGDSAGGGLCLGLAQMLRDEDAALPDTIVLLSPWLDLQLGHAEHRRSARLDRMLAIPGLRWAARQWAGSLPLEDARVSPLNGSLSRLPPIAVLTGTHDLLNIDARRLRDQAMAMHHPLTYLEYPGMFHVWMAAPIPEAASALDQVAAFLNS